MDNTSSCCAPANTCTSAEIFTSSVKLIAATQCCFTDEFSSDELQDGAYFDFIIVGGGSAGSVVANRLSEVKEWNVLLLEAGPKPPTTAFTPQLASLLLATKYDWNYTTINNNRTSQGLLNGQVLWNRGKVLGGSSMINAMFYVKGRKEDYQTWYAEGNPSWNPENIAFYERKAESLQNMLLRSNPNVTNFYGKSGYQVINKFNSTRAAVNNKVLDSWESIGMKRFTEREDLNSAEYKGRGICGESTVTAANGIRYGTYNSYLLPVSHRRNLKIVTDAFVTRVLISNDKSAYGVEVVINKKKMKFYVTKEVIVSAGTINSPQLLMLSGIGPKKHLESKNISCKVNLPAVGKNLQDHLRVFLPIYGDVSNLEERNERNCSVEQYCCNKTGFLAQGGVEGIVAFYSYNKYLKYPEFQNHLLILNENINTYISSDLGYKQSYAESILKYSNKNRTLYLFFVHLLHPYSRGSILLNTSNPYDKPIIDANYFGDKRDLILTAKGIMLISKIVNTEFFKSINAFIPRIEIPECDKSKYDSLDYWMCYANFFVNTIYHPAGTCKMGPTPISSVVANNLNVYRVKGLRVIDASIMPKLTSGNINAPTIVIGEMGSSMIKKSYSKNEYL